MYQHVMENVLLITNNNSCWSIGCSNHVYACIDAFYDSKSDKVPGEIGLTVKEAVEKYVFTKGERIIATDVQPWPKNKACS